MSEAIYEFSGAKLGMRQPDFFLGNSTNTFDFDIAFEEARNAVHICNKKVFAGYFPLLKARSIGYACTKVHRSWDHIRRNPIDMYVLRIPIRGSMHLDQFGQRVNVGEGEIGVSYANAPFRAELRPNLNCECLVLQAYVPTHVMSGLVPDARMMCGGKIVALDGPARLAKQTFLTLFEESEHLSHDLAIIHFSAGLEAFAEAVRVRNGITVQATSSQNKKLKRILDYIEIHSSEPNLTAEKVALGCRISTRYVHYLLKSDNKRFHDVLWQRRLSHAHRQITDKVNPFRSIAEIAAATGFKSSAHFSRLFRQKFGQSPRDARRGRKSVTDIMITKTASVA